jgi:protein-L-isoaspartate(D-aspartate) O-methyltransferase
MLDCDWSSDVCSSDLTLEVGDGAQGWGSACYDVIVLTGSTPVLPGVFQRSLNPGGRLFAIVGDAPTMEARMIMRGKNDEFDVVDIMEANVAPLQNAAQPKRFVF